MVLLEGLRQAVRSNHCIGLTTPIPSVWHSEVRQALLVIKTLGKAPAGSEVIASTENLSSLLDFATSFKDDSEASSQAFRCVANTLLLVPEARSTWTTNEVGGGEACVDLLYVCTLSKMTDLVTERLSARERQNQIEFSSSVAYYSFVLPRLLPLVISFAPSSNTSGREEPLWISLETNLTH
jgi:hypothetical protein